LRIGILELSSKTHYDPVYTRVKIFDNGCNEIFVFVEKGFLNEKYLFSENVHIYEYSNNKSIMFFLWNIKKQNLDYLLITTLLPSDLLLSPLILISNRTKIIVNIHNANRWFKPQLNYTPKGMLKYFIIYLWKKSLYGITVSNENMIKYLQRNLKYQINSYLLPFSIYEEKEVLLRKESNENLKVTIPGIYSQRRRDYFGLIEALKKFSPDEVSMIIFNFLGSKKDTYEDLGLGIYESLYELKSLNYNIEIYDGFIPEDEYELELISTNIIFCPVNISGYPGEVYGLTKDTASTAMMIKYSIPGLLPNLLLYQSALKSSVITYDTLSNAIERLIVLQKERKEYESLKIEAQKNSKKYSIQRIRESISLETRT
jgi:hypothetical protein